MFSLVINCHIVHIIDSEYNVFCSSKIAMMLMVIQASVTIVSRHERVLVAE